MGVLLVATYQKKTGNAKGVYNEALFVLGSFAVHYSTKNGCTIYKPVELSLEVVVIRKVNEGADSG